MALSAAEGKSIPLDYLKTMGAAAAALGAVCRCHVEGLIFLNNRLYSAAPVVTNSNKLRAFTTARMPFDQDLLNIIVTGRIRMDSLIRNVRKET